MIFETHAHYDDEAYNEDRHQLIEKMHREGIEYIINVTADLESLETTKALTGQYDFIYGTVGLHPSAVESLNEEKLALMLDYGRQEKIVAVGEIGLDYFYLDPEKSIQKKWFIRQMELARELNLPVIIHSREACADTLSIMQSEEFRDMTGVIHCYSYSTETAKEYLNMGYYFGIGGVVTFKNSKKVVEAVKYIPIDRILLETDSPYLAPVPNRGTRNNSLNLTYVAETIAQIKNIPYDDVISITNSNAKRLFFKKYRNK